MSCMLNLSFLCSVTNLVPSESKEIKVWQRKNRHIQVYKKCQIFIPLQKMVSLLVSVLYLLKIEFRKYHFWPAKTSKILCHFFSCNFSDFCCTHSWIWAPTGKPEVIWPWIFPCFNCSLNKADKNYFLLAELLSVFSLLPSIRMGASKYVCV